MVRDRLGTSLLVIFAYAGAYLLGPDERKDASDGVHDPRSCEVHSS